MLARACLQELVVHGTDHVACDVELADVVQPAGGKVKVVVVRPSHHDQVGSGHSCYALSADTSFHHRAGCPNRCLVNSQRTSAKDL